jgi:hypothetical protein
MGLDQRGNMVRRDDDEWIELRRREGEMVFD